MTCKPRLILNRATTRSPLPSRPTAPPYSQVGVEPEHSILSVGLCRGRSLFQRGRLAPCPLAAPVPPSFPFAVALPGSDGCTQ